MERPPEVTSEALMPLSDLAGLLSADLTSAIGRGLFSPSVMRSPRSEDSDEIELIKFGGLDRKRSKRSTSFG
jgi:hypothetical protein